MLNFSPGEVLCVAIVALVVLGPEKLPEAAEKAARWIKKIKKTQHEISEKVTDVLEKDD